MLLTVQVLDKLQVVLERQIASIAIEACTLAALALRRTRRNELGFADLLRNVKARLTSFCFACIRGCGSAADVFLPSKRGFVPGFAFFFDLAFALGRFHGILLAIPGSAEGSVVAGRRGAIRAFAIGHD